jgi:hypothetical protein
LRPGWKSFGPIVALTAGLWLFWYANMTVRSLVDEPKYLADISLRRGMTATFGVCLCLALAWLLLRLTRRVGWRQWTLALTLALPASLAWSLFTFVVMHYRSPWPMGHSPGEPYLEIFLNTAAMFLLFMAWACGWVAITYGGALADRELRLARAELSAADARNQMLRYQLNPHLMFNTLNALSTLILERDWRRADGLVTNLSKFLRASLARAPQEKVTVGEEVDIQQQYLAIEHARFEDRLVVRVAVAPEAEACLVPSLILQPLVENAIKFAVMPNKGLVTVAIEAQAQNGRLHLAVRDDGAGPPGNASSLGMGIENVRRRLAVVYGAQAAFTAGPRRSGGFEAALEIPAERR